MNARIFIVIVKDMRNWEKHQVYMVAAVYSLEGFYHSSKTYQSCIVDVAVHLK